MLKALLLKYLVRRKMFQSQLREQFPYDTYFMSAVPNLFVITYPGWEPLLNAIIFVTTTFKSLQQMMFLSLVRFWDQILSAKNN